MGGSEQGTRPIKLDTRQPGATSWRYDDKDKEWGGVEGSLQVNAVQARQKEWVGEVPLYMLWEQASVLGTVAGTLLEGTHVYRCYGILYTVKQLASCLDATCTGRCMVVEAWQEAWPALSHAHTWILPCRHQLSGASGLSASHTYTCPSADAAESSSPSWRGAKPRCLQQCHRP